MVGTSNEVERICKLLMTFPKISNRKEKEELLKKNDGPTLKFLLETLFNPYLTYGVKKISKEIKREDVPDFSNLESCRKLLVGRDVTGHAAIKLLEETINCRDEEVRKCLTGVFIKDLRLGIDVKTVNKIFPNFIPTFDIGLCEPFEDPTKLPSGKWAVEPKYDGLRGVIVIDDNGLIQVYSRTGKEMYNTEYIVEELKTMNLKGFVLDGEIFGHDWNLSVGVAHTQSDHPDKDKLKFHVFDMVTFREWKDKKSVSPYYLRKTCIQTMFEKCKYLVPAPEVTVNTYEEAVLEYQKRLNEGYEGVVLKEINSFYPFDRSKFWLKWKPVHTVDIKIIGYAEGVGRNAGRLGAFICEHNGVQSDVGGGYSDDLRIKFWNERDQMVGKTIEVECQEITKDGKLRFPVFIRLRIDKD